MKQTINRIVRKLEPPNAIPINESDKTFAEYLEVQTRFRHLSPEQIETIQCEIDGQG